MLRKRSKGGRNLKQNKVKEVQEYLKENGIKVSEVAIIKAAIDIARRLSGLEDWVFVREFQENNKNERGKKGEQV